ncbi:putative selenate ABC transporter substrate-binding protein [Oceanobacter mangrovi]|uniref:putative selenate ABC transporter substrate-binding protein n=1 Tax=Oceanobacter mangrovi TaxID=2862510 RepID=UPI001C8E2BBD|nr:putative selenate ABC transporter substrate-binding protein [Oceanobacter mangrovi]
MKLFQRLVASAALLAAAAVAQAETFVFTAIPDQDESRLNERFGKVADYLSEQLDVEVKYIPVKSYAAAITAFRNNQVQLAWFGGLSGVQARRLVPDSEALAQGVEDEQFKSYIIANRKVALTINEDLASYADVMKGKTFTFGSKGSTSGRLMPEYFLREAFNKAPDELFDRVGFSGDHSRTVTQVESGAWDFGAVNFSVWDDMVAQGQVNTDKVQVIWTSPTYPDYQWTIRGDVDGKFGNGFKDKVRSALLNMKDKDLLKSFPREGFIPATNADYAPIETTAKAIGLLD